MPNIERYSRFHFHSENQRGLLGRETSVPIRAAFVPKHHSIRPCLSSLGVRSHISCFEHGDRATLVLKHHGIRAYFVSLEVRSHIPCFERGHRLPLRAISPPLCIIQSVMQSAVEDRYPPVRQHYSPSLKTQMIRVARLARTNESDHVSRSGLITHRAWRRTLSRGRTQS